MAAQASDDTRSLFAITVTAHERPPYYRGSLPLTYKSYAKSLLEVPIPRSRFVVATDFGSFTTVFDYGDGWENAGIAQEGKTVDLSGHVLARAKVLRNRIDNSKGSDGVDLRESHYDERGNIVFECTSYIDEQGIKRSESDVQGKKRQDFYFTWPVDLF